MRTREGKGRYLVSPSGFDDIGAVLTDMGDAFDHEDIEWDDIESPGVLEGCDVLFINCAGESGDEDYAERIAPTIKQFVTRGGSLYCSDWAGAVLKRAFPGVLEFDQDGTACELECSVVDEGLRELIGPSISIHFDLPGWWRITESRGDFRRYVVGPDKQPVVAAFASGRGHVIYTAFHNEAQLSESEKKLLRYLVLRPVLARVAGAAAQVAKAAQCTPGREILATINRGQHSDPYVYNATGTERLLYVLSWTGAGQLRLVVTDPSGKMRHDGSSASPMQFETSGTPGKWTCTVEAISVPHDNFPYVLTLATRRQPAGQTPPPTPASSQAPKRQAGAASPGMLWPCYIIMDCSRWASDAGPAIGQGLSAFIRGLARLPFTNVTPALSLVESRAGAVAVPTPRRITELAPVNLACQGEAALKSALTALQSVLEKSDSRYRGKPFIVVLLAANPNDDFPTAAQQLKQLAAMGRANVAAIGLGRQVSDSTLCALATIPLRIPDPTIQNCVSCFEWLVHVADSIVRALSQASGQAVTLPPLPKGVQWLR